MVLHNAHQTGGPHKRVNTKNICFWPGMGLIFIGHSQNNADPTKNCLMKIILLLFVLLYIPAISGAQTFNTGIDTVISKHLYVVHSERRNINNPAMIQNTSNIYVLRGINDSVWVFGTGYGDTLDYRAYGQPTITTGPAYDAALTDSIIRYHFSLNRAAAKVQFIVPHEHLDHINQEFISALFALTGYDFSKTNIYVHQNDLAGSTCNAKCCGTSGCNQNNQYWAVPYLSPWNSATLAKFQALGIATNPCNKILKVINAWCNEKWQIRKADIAHTTGAVNLVNTVRKVVIYGTAYNTNCKVVTDNSWKTLQVHGNIPNSLPGPNCTIPGNFLRRPPPEAAPALFTIHPNPAQDYLLVNPGGGAEIRHIELFNRFGQPVYKTEIKNNNRIIVPLVSLTPGAYFIRIRFSDHSIVNKPFMISR
jgi:Secretion system C-terminal sorting domain